MLEGKWYLLPVTWSINVFINVFLNFKGNSDIERYQMANKKIPFKYARPVEEWLQEKGNFKQTCFFAYVCSL